MAGEEMLYPTLSAANPQALENVRQTMRFGKQSNSSTPSGY